MNFKNNRLCSMTSCKNRRNVSLLEEIKISFELISILSKWQMNNFDITKIEKINIYIVCHNIIYIYIIIFPKNFQLF